LTLSDEQQQALDILMKNIKKSGVGRLPSFHQKPFVYRVGGYAGTGKTHLLCTLRNEIRTFNRKINVAFATFTGKASSVLKNKLTEGNAIRHNDYIGTIHGMIYRAETKYDKILKTHVVIGWKRIPYDEFFYDLIVIDEGSMVSKDIWEDLQAFGRPIIVVGDHGQLPPVSEKAFSLMHKPNFILSKIHRQAEDNPIIQLSAFIRKHGYIPNQIWSPGVFKVPWEHEKTQRIWKSLDHDEKLIVLCGFNATRCGLNRNIRGKMKYKKKTPYPGERIVCLRNNHTIKLMNGQIGTMMWLMPEDTNIYRLTIDVDNDPDPYECIAHMSTFDQVTYTTYSDEPKIKIAQKYAKEQGYELDYFDYGYCISVHKSQGSEWDKVILFEQRTKFWDDEYYKRWLYTGVTRAKEKLMVVSDYWG
jgi:exodeoxyribonuclease-5